MTETIKSLDGKFYAGMTRKVAEEKNKTKHFFEDDYVTVFDNMDVNKNGVIDQYEICEHLADKHSNSLGNAAIFGLTTAALTPKLLKSKFGKLAIVLGVGSMIAEMITSRQAKNKYNKYLNDIKQKNETKAA